MYVCIPICSVCSTYRTYRYAICLRYIFCSHESVGVSVARPSRPRFSTPWVISKVRSHGDYVICVGVNVTFRHTAKVTVDILVTIKISQSHEYCMTGVISAIRVPMATARCSGPGNLSGVVFATVTTSLHSTSCLVTQITLQLLKQNL